MNAELALPKERETQPVTFSSELIFWQVSDSDSSSFVFVMFSK